MHDLAGSQGEERRGGKGGVGRANRGVISSCLNPIASLGPLRCTEADEIPRILGLSHNAGGLVCVVCVSAADGAARYAPSSCGLAGTGAGEGRGCRGDM